jgi:DMSO reductase anchor subunit
MIDKIIEQPITALALLLMLFGVFFAAFFKRTQPISTILIWATLFTLLAVISLLVGVGGSRYIDFIGSD